MAEKTEALRDECGQAHNPRLTMPLKVIDVPEGAYR